MATYKIILGENGQGKTRFLLKILKQKVGAKNVAVISNSAINPFPMPRQYRNSRYALFNMKAQMPVDPSGFSRQLYNRINNLIRSEVPEDIFYVLRFLGFDEIIRVHVAPLYYLSGTTDDDGKNYFNLKRRSNEFRSFYIEHASVPLEDATLSPNLAELFGGYFRSNFTIDFTPHGSHTGYARYNKVMSDLKEIDEYLLNRKAETTSLFRKQYIVSKNGEFFNLEAASSGELYIFGLGLFIRRALDDFKRLNTSLETIFLIDEPENSLHPKWQKEYINFLDAFIGYESVRVVIATHSPFIAVGGESQDASLYKMSDGELEEYKKDLLHSNIEEIYLKLFDILTPKNKFLSELCNNLLKNYAEDNSSYDDTLKFINSLNDKAYDNKQRSFLKDIIGLLDKIHAQKAESGKYNDRIF